MRRTQAEDAPSTVQVDLSALEAQLDVRVGVLALDTGSGAVVEHRADERFAYASTIKAFAAGAVLTRTTAEQMEEPVTVGSDDLVAYSPVTEQRVGSTMTLRELAKAAVQSSDNTAANLLFEKLGGPAGLEEELRALGADVTEVERVEPDLNEATAGDIRDTSTPRAMATTLAGYAVGDTLDGEDRATLNAWLTASTTGTGLVCAGVPAGWVVGDKSGSGRYGTRNDIAVVRPPGGAPLVIAVMTSREDEPAERRDEAVAAATAAAIEALAP